MILAIKVASFWDIEKTLKSAADAANVAVQVGGVWRFQCL